MCSPGAVNEPLGSFMGACIWTGIPLVKAKESGKRW
jgi:hypothetical protein